MNFSFLLYTFETPLGIFDKNILNKCLHRNIRLSKLHTYVLCAPTKRIVHSNLDITNLDIVNFAI